MTALTVVRDVPAPSPVATSDRPRGWDALAALGPVARRDVPCSKCGGPPVVMTPTNAHCADHPPVAGEWGSTLDWTPDGSTGKCKTSGRQSCYCGRCLHYPRPSVSLAGVRS